MFLPVLFIALAMMAGMVVAYGTHPNWAQYQHGMDLIVWSRTLQWPLVALSLLLCLALICLVIAGKRRAWWLIGLGPILALFVHRFDATSANNMIVLENPPYTTAEQATFLEPEDYVVGVEFGGSSYAYPYSILYRVPVVIQDEQAKRMILMWSPFANRAMAVQIDRQLKRRELEIVSMPANALLIYDSRLGQFINGLTALTIKGHKPIGFRASLPASRLKWQEWRAAHPLTKVMLPQTGHRTPGPAEPILPYYKMPPMKLQLPANTPVALIATTRPVAVPSDALGTAPVNLPPGDLPVVLLRDRITDGLRAFDRRLNDLVLHFVAYTGSRRTNVAMIDLDTRTGWNSQGVAVDGDNAAMKGRKLTRLRQVEDDLYWGVMKFWYPDVQLYQPPPPESAIGDADTQPSLPNGRGHDPDRHRSHRLHAGH